MKPQIFSPEYPFMLRNSLHENTVEQQVSLWIDCYSCLPESLKKRYRKSNFGKFTTCLFPNANAEQSLAMGKWVLAAFAFDDLYGSLSAEELKIKCREVICLLEGNDFQTDKNEIFKAFFEAGKEFLPHVTSSWMKRLIEDHEFWFDGMIQETEYSYTGKAIYPTLEEYKIIREKVSGGRIMCDFLEISSDFIMPDEVFLHPVIFKIRQLVTFMLSWFNDIHSVPWELERGEATNLVLVIKNEQNCSFEEAYEMAVEIHNDDLAEFIHITKNLPDFGKYNEGVKRYVHNAELFLKGQESWYFGGTERYTSAEKSTS
jgi:hypothetical protein